MYTDFPEVPEGFHEAIQKSVAILEDIIPVIEQLLSIPKEELSPEHKRLIARFCEIFKLIDQAKNIIDHRLLFRANIYFHHIESLAKSGNPEARKIYEDLLPSYRAALQEDLDNSVN